MTPAVIDAGRAALEVDGVHADRGRHHADAVRLQALQPDVAVAERLHRRHRIGLALRPPDFLGLGIARHADLGRDLVVVRRDVGVIDRPIEAFAVLAFHFEVGRQIAREVGEVMQRGAADAPAALIGVAVRIFALEQERHAGRLDAPAPHIRTDQVAHLPVGAGFDQHDLLAGFRQHGGVERSRRAGADDDDIHFFMCRHGYHLFSGAICGM